MVTTIITECFDIPSLDYWYILKKGLVRLTMTFKPSTNLVPNSIPFEQVETKRGEGAMFVRTRNGL